MNMKKTMAAIAAGAVAVSAMATTVSALESTTLHYNLYASQDVWTKGTVQVSGTITNVPGNSDLKVGFDGLWVNGYRLSALTVIVKDSAGGAGSKTFQYNTAWGSDNWFGWSFEDNKVVIPEISLDDATVESYDVTVIGTVEHSYAEWAGSTTNVKEDLANTRVSVAYTASETDADGKVTTSNKTATNETFVANYKQPTKVTKAFPFETTIAGNSVTAQLAANKYVNTTAVLNDAIENYDSVVFTFNTAAAPIKWVVDRDFNNNVKGSYDEAYVLSAKIKENNPKAGIIEAVYDEQGVKDYMSFSQHLYNNFYNPENTGYLGLDWNGVNLFQGALVINEGYTMSLADTDYFDWTATSLTFDWDAIEDSALTTNDYATFIHSIKLATSTRWYWDSLDVALTVGAEEDGVDTEAGVVADDEELAEEEVEEEVTEEVEEEVEEPEVEVEVSNPTTGNASVALAVIPVALAAAAVVAKKRS